MNITVRVVEKFNDKKKATHTHTKEILKKIDTCLESVGSDKTKILQAVIWLSDMKYFAELNEVWNAWVPEGYAPARACGEAKLARAELSVEIIITAAK